ncbi:2-keto-3-deoxy-galactonokinase [Paraburkholderia strydomiana]|nr:2-keto-3-deoxy-galactonokinase [Paraburkholderia strydomiana]
MLDLLTICRLQFHRARQGGQLSAGALVPVHSTSGTPIRIKPRLIEDGELPTVMRGEERQIVGASLQEAALARGDVSALVGLPGTRCKWAIVANSGMSTSTPS